MAVDALSAVGSSASGAASRSAFGDLKAEEFVKIIFTELANQDPLEPNDSQALLQQLSTIRSIQSDIDMGTRLGSLVAQNEMAAAAGLIGRTIRGRGESGSLVTGGVKSVTRTADGPVLNLEGGQRVRMSAVNEVLAAVQPAGGGAS
jgi:flagellar basal-body rod modification protein FlgD